jgi:hypothetical protein
MKRRKEVFLKKLFVLLSASFVLSCGGGIERIGTSPEAAGGVYVHSPRAPRIALVRAERGDRMPDLAADALLWTASLPLGDDEARRPAILVAASADGRIAERMLWIDRLGTGDFRSADPVPLEPDPEDDAAFWAGPIPFAYEASLPTGSVPVTASFRVLLQVTGDGGRVRLYPADTRVGSFPAGGPRFLLYDEDRNGVYDLTDRMVIDADGDGTFDGNRNSVELYSLGEAFLLAGKAKRVTEIAWDGSTIAVGPANEKLVPRVALVPGNPAPDFTLPDFAGNPVAFAAARAGRPTLLSYWATW